MLGSRLLQLENALDDCCAEGQRETFAIAHSTLKHRKPDARLLFGRHHPKVQSSHDPLAMIACENMIYVNASSVAIPLSNQ